MAIGKRPTADVNGHALPAEGNRDAWGDQFPVLFDYLTATTWEGGEPRETANLTLFWQDGMFKVCIHDKDLNRVLFVAGASVLEALSRADRDIESGRADWRPSKDRPGRKYR